KSAPASRASRQSAMISSIRCLRSALSSWLDTMDPLPGLGLMVSALMMHHQPPLAQIGQVTSFVAACLDHTLSPQASPGDPVLLTFPNGCDSSVRYCQLGQLTDSG